MATIVNSHLDTVIVGAMRQYASAAARLGLPSRTEEVRLLSAELTTCMEQAEEFQVCSSYPKSCTPQTHPRRAMTPSKRRRRSARRMPPLARAPTRTSCRASSTSYWVFHRPLLPWLASPPRRAWLCLPQTPPLRLRSPSFRRPPPSLPSRADRAIYVRLAMHAYDVGAGWTLRAPFKTRPPAYEMSR